MGRGGKKKGKKDEEEKKSEEFSKAVSDLAIQPSTSTAATGLVTTQDKTEPGSKLKEVISVSESSPSKSIPAESKQTTTAADDDDDKGGLGLGDGRKKRPRKKKQAASVESSQKESIQGPSFDPKAGLPPIQSVVQQGQITQPLQGQVGPSVQRHVEPLYQGQVTQPLQGQVRPPFRGHAPPPFRGQVMPPAFQGHASPPFRGQAMPPAFQGHASPPFRGQATTPPWGHVTTASPDYRAPFPSTVPTIQRPVGPPVGHEPPPGFPTPHVQPPSSSRLQAGYGRGSVRPLPGATAPPPGSGPKPPLVQQRQQPKLTEHETTPQQRAIAKPQDVQKPSRFAIPDKIIGRSVRSRSVQVLTNYLPMKIKGIKIYRYDVAFTPDRPKKLLPKAFQASFKQQFPKHVVAFDQIKNFYSMEALPNVTATERFTDNVEIVDNNGKKMKFEVSYKATGIVDLNTILDYMKGGTSLNPPTEAIQCVDVILRQGTLESYVKCGRTFFKRPANPILLEDGLEMWTGLFQSAIFTSSPFVNIDVAHKGFPINQPVMNLLQTFRLDFNSPLERQNRYFYETLNSFLKGLKVVANVGGNVGVKREFICNGVGQPANRQKFTLTDNAGKQIEMTVADYFIREKNYRLKYPNLNVLSVGPRDKNIYYPMELLEVAYGQVSNKQLNERQLSKMVREAASPPADRLRKIKEVLADMNYSKNIYFKKFGLEISEEFLKVGAKILDPPKLRHGDSVVQPRNGQWIGNRMLQGATLNLWGFIAIDLDQRGSNSHEIITLMKNCGRSMGIMVEEPCLQKYNVRIQDLELVMQEALKKNLQLLFVAMPTRGRDIYSQVKKVAERNVGMLTQCLKEQTATRRMNSQTARNILLKVNSKLMGINQILDATTLPRCLRDGDVMVVGADVTHPSPDQTTVPSIAAVTASIDRDCFHYNIGLSIQTPKKEMIVEFEDMMVEHLKLYRKRLRHLPKKIYVFRDGVSEGQFAEVMNSELQAVYNAYRTLSGTEEKPKVLFQLVQKRHHTRMFTMSNPPQNVEPGTVIDKDIVHVRELDFYLVSHQAIKGTARPTRYHAVCNDDKLPHDEVEQLTYYLCHLYSRCLRSVSYPTPTYYAHLACLRARVLTLGEKFDNSKLERNPQRLRVFDRILEQSPMFFV